MDRIALQSIAVVMAATFAVTSATANTDWTNLTLKFSLADKGELIADPGRLNSWFDIPLSVATAEEAGWVEAIDASYFNVKAYCLPDDHHVCILMNSHGDIAGYQFALSVDELEELQYFFDVTAMQMYVPRTVFGRDCWTVTILFESPDTIAAGGSRITNGVLGGNRVWIQLKNGFLTVPEKIDDLDSIWIRGKCVPAMGVHFYYNISRNMECKYLEPVFLIYNKGLQTGVGLMTFGSINIIKRDWFETGTAADVNMTAISKTPMCLLKGAEIHGYLSLHAYFVNQPWKLECDSS